MSEQRTKQHIQIAEIDVDPAQLDSYEAAVAEQIEAAIRLEPGVLVLYSVANKENPAHVTVFEIYRDREAYLAHLQAHPQRSEVPRQRWSPGSVRHVRAGRRGCRW